MFNLQVLLVWFKTFRLYHTICSIYQYFKSGSQLLDGITLYVQLISTSCVAQNFWIEPPCMFNLSVFHVWIKIWMETPCMFNLSVLDVCLKTCGWNHPVCSTCLFFMSGSKLLKWKPPVCSTFLLHVWFKNLRLNHPVCLICQYSMSGSKLLY